MLPRIAKIGVCLHKGFLGSGCSQCFASGVHSGVLSWVHSWVYVRRRVHPLYVAAYTPCTSSRTPPVRHHVVLIGLWCRWPRTPDRPGGWTSTRPPPARRGSPCFLSRGRVLGSKKRCKARGRVLRGCWVSVHGFGVSVRLRGSERVLVVFGG